MVVRLYVLNTNLPYLSPDCLLTPPDEGKPEQTMHTKYRHLFFDLDHTLWDFENNSRAVLSTLYQEHNLATLLDHPFEAFRERFEYHNERFWARFRNGHMTRKDLRWKRLWHTLLDFKNGDLALAHTLSAHYIELLPSYGALMPYAREVLDYCSEKGYHLHLITNGFESAQWKKMDSAGISTYFKAVVTSENSNSMKPQPEIFSYALTAAGASSSESLMIGDTLEADVIGAQRSGIDQVYYNVKSKTHNESPTFEIGCLSRMMDIV